MELKKDYAKFLSSPSLATLMLSLYLAADIKEMMKEYGLTNADAASLFQLYRRDGRTQSELGRRINANRTYVMNSLKKMEQMGLVVRRKGQDSRAKYVFITDQGRQKVDELLDVYGKGDQKFFGSFTPTELEFFLALLRKVIIEGDMLA